MQALARNGYSAAQVRAALHASNRQLTFRYELLDSSNAFKKHLSNILGASVANNSLANIKRTARFRMTEDADINFLADRIKPYCRLWIPPGLKVPSTNYYFITPGFPAEFATTIQKEPAIGGWAEFPLGVFLLSTPPRKEENGVIYREVEAYDLLKVVEDDKVEDRYTVAANDVVTDEVKTILDGAGLTMQNITKSTKTLPAARDWPPGTKKLTIINELLFAINYQSLTIDENGYALVRPYVAPSVAASEYTYRDDDESVIFPGPEQVLDLFDIPNKWVLVVSEPDREPLVATYTNSNADSPTSTVSRGRTIVDYREYQEAVDQETLNARAARLASEKSQVYEHVVLETGIMPMHSNADMIALEYTGLGISAKYAEVSWSYELKAGARMRHDVRRVVDV